MKHIQSAVSFQRLRNPDLSHLTPADLAARPFDLLFPRLSLRRSKHAPRGRLPFIHAEFLAQTSTHETFHSLLTFSFCRLILNGETEEERFQARYETFHFLLTK
ncbi:hypothetical protein I6F15_31960 [Bradyrhizobium sp. BRP14]|nr:hypothetical protein [Bradyrhizobium sp. BRP14]